MKITIVGCGNMGLTYSSAFLKYNIVSSEDLLLAEKNAARRDELARLDLGRVTVVSDVRVSESDMIIICVKPQDFVSLCPVLKPVLTEKNLIISIMAGINIEKISAALEHKNIVRAMPNSPAELGMGMTAFTSAKNLAVDLVRKAENLLSTTGRTVFLEDEQLMDAVTALSGSGPAYFFYIVKNMIEAGQEMGFDEATSAMLVKQTMLGSFHLLNTSGKKMDELIHAVSSKGGTTEAAFRIFDEGRIGETLQKGILRACTRGKELSQSL